MNRRAGRVGLSLAGAEALFMLACGQSRGFSRFMLERVSRPGTALLHRLTARIPFPVVEPLALLLAAGLAAALLFALGRALRKKSGAPLLDWLRGLLWGALALLGALTLLWLPACSLPGEAPPVPEAGPLEWLCGDLIDRLNDSALEFPPATESLRAAPAVARLPGRVVKAVRYPEWMAATGISGLFMPLTGEALADATEPAPLIPFTAVHELTHLAGIADEGAANIAAWERCLDAGGVFADSARLWALRYAMGLLDRADPAAQSRVRAKMKGPLARVFQECNGAAVPEKRSPLGIPGLCLSPGDYTAIVPYLIARRP